MAKSLLAKAIHFFYWGDRFKLLIIGPEYILLKGPNPNPAFIALVLFIVTMSLAIWASSLLFLTVYVALSFQLFSRNAWEWDKIGTYDSQYLAIEAKSRLIKKHYTL